MGKIASDVGAVQAAVSGIQGVSVTGSQTVSLGQSNISSMQDGAEVANRILPDLQQLVSCVKTQADKFPQLAEIIALRDSQVKFNAGE